MTLSDMQSLASDYLDDPSNGYFTLPQLTTRLNLAQRETQKRLILAGQQYYGLPVYTTMVVGQDAYTLPSDFMNIIRLSYVTSGTGRTALEQRIPPITPNQKDLMSDAVTGAPRYYYFQNNWLMVKPVPDLAYQLRLEYTYAVTDLANATDSPDVPTQFHEYIVLSAVRDFMIKDNRPLGNVEAKLKEYEVLLKQMAQDRSSDGARMVISTDALDW